MKTLAAGASANTSGCCSTGGDGDCHTNGSGSQSSPEKDVAALKQFLNALGVDGVDGVDASAFLGQTGKLK